MSDLITRTARLVPYAKRPKQVASFVTAYSYEPLPDEPGADLGSLYIVMEVLVSGRASEEVADLVIETIGDQYYNQLPSTISDPLARFETAIKATNQELSGHVNRGNAAWIGKLSAIIAIQVASDLHVAQTGSAEAFLYRGKAASHVSGDTVSRPATPAKTFGSIATGQLEPGDRLLLATPALIHQVPLSKLQSIVSGSSPNAAIAEITDLLRGASIDRIASLVIEITTPEQAALHIRSEAPSEIQLGSPENMLDAAKMAAAPIAQNTIASSRKMVSAAHSGWKRATPHAKAFGFAVAGRIREALATRGGRRVALITISAAIVATFGIIWYNHTTQAASKVFSAYQQAYSSFEQGQNLLDNGHKADARTVFSNTAKTLETYKPNESQINARLKTSALPEAEPRSFSEFQSLISARIDQIDGLVKVAPINVVNIATKNSRAEHFELFGNTAYIFDSGTNNALFIANVVTGQSRSSKADMSKLGDVVSTTISSANDGIFILTNKPSVWFYRFDSDTLSEQTIAFGQWPSASAIASYASNLYLLSNSNVYKHVKNSTGFSPKTDYLTTTSTKAAGSTSLAVDGSVYLISPSGLQRYLAGALQSSTTVPDSLPQVTNLRSTSDGAIIIGTSSSADRVALWQVKNDTVTFDKQVALQSSGALYDATYDAKSGNIYATIDGRLVRFPVRP